MNFITTHKVWITVIGMIGLATYQATQGDLNTAIATFLAAIAAAGLKFESL